MMNVPYSSPDVSLPRDGGEMLNLNELRPKNVVLFFYPRDATPTCTKEAIAFSQAKEDFEKFNTVIIGISKDDIKSHEKFILKNDLKIPLLSDDRAEICEAFDVWKEKSMFGNTFLGIQRDSFLIDEEGKILKHFAKVQPKKHVTMVMKEVE